MVVAEVARLDVQEAKPSSDAGHMTGEDRLLWPRRLFTTKSRIHKMRHYILTCTPLPGYGKLRAEGAPIKGNSHGAYV